MVKILASEEIIEYKKVNFYLKDTLLDVIELAAQIKIKEEKEVKIFFYFNGIPVFIKSRDIPAPPQKIIKAIEQIRKKERRKKLLSKRPHEDHVVGTVEDVVEKKVSAYFFEYKERIEYKKVSEWKTKWKILKKMEDTS